MSKKKSPSDTHKGRKLTHADRERLEAYCFLELADYKSAMNPAQQALKLTKKNAQASTGDKAASEAILALALRGLGKYHQALVHAENAHNLEPNNPDFTYVYGLCSWYSQPDNNALKIIKDALDKMPKRFDVRLDYAGFLLQQQRFDEALEQVNIAAELAPNNTKGKFVRKCAQSHSWCELTDMLVSTPPLPIAGDKSFIYTAIASSHLNANGFEIAMNKCSRALDCDIDNEKAKGIYCTAHYLKEHDIAGLCHDFSNKMKKLNNRLIFLFTPLIALLFVGVYYFKQEDLYHTKIFGVAFLVYLLIYFILQMGGDVHVSAKHFEDIIRSEHLSPQGRPQHVKHSPKKANDLDDTPSDVVPDTFDSLLEVANQIRRNSSRIAGTSATYLALTVLAMLGVIATIIIQSNPEAIISPIIPWIQRFSGVAAIIFAILAYNRRQYARTVLQRAVDHRITDSLVQQES